MGRHRAESLTFHGPQADDLGAALGYWGTIREAVRDGLRTPLGAPVPPPVPVNRRGGSPGTVRLSRTA